MSPLLLYYVYTSRIRKVLVLLGTGNSYCFIMRVYLMEFAIGRHIYQDSNGTSGVDFGCDGFVGASVVEWV